MSSTGLDIILAVIAAAAADVEVERGDQDRADHEGVQQHPEGDREADLGDDTRGRVPRAAKVPASTTPDGYWSTVRRIFSIEAVRDRSSDTSATTRCWASRLFSAKCS